MGDPLEFSGLVDEDLGRQIAEAVLHKGDMIVPIEKTTIRVYHERQINVTAPGLSSASKRAVHNSLPYVVRSQLGDEKITDLSH